MPGCCPGGATNDHGGSPVYSKPIRIADAIAHTLGPWKRKKWIVLRDEALAMWQLPFEILPGDWTGPCDDRDTPFTAYEPNAIGLYYNCYWTPGSGYADHASWSPDLNTGYVFLYFFGRFFSRSQHRPSRAII